MKKVAKWILNGSLMALTAAIFTTLSCIALGPANELIDKYVFPGKVEKEKKDETETSERTPDEVAYQIESEGAVLLKNDGNLLPMTAEQLSKINVFGWASTNWIAGGSGSGCVTEKGAAQGASLATTDLLKALNDAGYQTNTELTNYYKSYESKRPSTSTGSLNLYSYQFSRLIEPKISEYKAGVLDNAKAYSKTALVVLGRESGESIDAPKVQYKGNSASDKVDDSSRHYLEISTEEEELLTYVGANFENVCVIINTTNTMELGFLKAIPGLDSCLQVGATGNDQAKAIPFILNGDINPSGRLADTISYDFKKAPYYANVGLDGEGHFTNSNDTFEQGTINSNKNYKNLYPVGITYGNVGTNPKYDSVSYIDYCEDIYVGYKWYETADTEGYFSDVNNDYGKGYDGVVQYPFGYGMSYTDFDWELKGAKSLSASSMTLQEHEYEVEVEVTNKGNKAGKDVVQLYYNPPYTKGGIEKASANLLTFAKTDELKPNESQTLTLTFKLDDLSAYDCYDKNKDNFKGYEVEKGDYKLQLKTDSHHVKDMTDSTITLSVSSNLHFDEDVNSGKKVENKFTSGDAMDTVSIDGVDSNANIKYLSRSDFKSTFPTSIAANRAMTDKEKELNLYSKEEADKEIDLNDKDIVTSVDKGMKIADSEGKLTDLGKELGKDYNDSRWDDLLNQMSLDEIKNLTLNGYGGTNDVASIGKPKLKDCDGPNQIGSFGMTQSHGIGYPNSTVIAQTFNVQLAEEFGKSFGKEARANGFDGWYGPGMNIHRSAFGGRNYEYYSEDATLSSKMAEYVITGSNSAGIYCYLKHVALYEQDEMRDSLYTYVTEQAFREIYLRPFKAAVQLGHAQGIMTSYNRVGAVWAGGSKALITGVMRNEWDFKGCVLTDYCDHHEYMNMDQALRAGGDLWMGGVYFPGFFGEPPVYSFEQESNTFKQKVREASKHIIYSWLAQTPDKLKITTAPWRPVLITLDVVAGLGIATWAFFIFAFPIIKEKKTQKAEPKTE